jgi:hypothetical protein
MISTVGRCNPHGGARSATYPGGQIVFLQMSANGCRFDRQISGQEAQQLFHASVLTGFC